MRSGLLLLWCVSCCLLSAVSARADDLHPHPSDSDTLLIWRFDEKSGDVATDVMRRARAELSDGCGWAKGRFGNALSLTGNHAGVKAKLERPIVFAAGQSFTIELWVRTAVVGRTQQLFNAQPYLELEVRSEDGQISFNLRSADGQSARCTGRISIADGRWHHVAAVRDAKEDMLRLYIDGRLDVEMDDPTDGAAIQLGTSPIIGGTAHGKEMFEGQLDDLRLSSIARQIKPWPIEQSSFKKQVHQLENEHVRFAFTADRNRIYLSSLLDKRSGVDFVRHDLPADRLVNLWQLSLRDANGSMTALNERQAILSHEADKNSLLFTWKKMSVGGALDQTADVQMRVDLPADSPFAQFRFRVDNHSRRYGAWILKAPRITNLRKLESDGRNEYVAIPGGNGGGAGEGQLYRDPFNTLHPFVRTYPCYHQSMQFNAYYGSQAGLYLATYDGDMHLKGFLIKAHSGEQPTLLYELHNYPADAGVQGTGFDADYPSVIGPFSGDWYDAARIYRKWALKQKWARLGPVHQRKDITPWLRDGAYWIMMPLDFEAFTRPHLRKKARTLPEEEVQRLARRVDVNATLERLRIAQEYFGFPMVLWSNEWFEGGGDTSPPRYIPMNKLDQFLDKLEKQFPEAYFSAHIQPKRYSTQLREYGPEVIRNQERAANNTYRLGPVMPGESNDQHAYPCWATDWWQKYWADKAFDRAKLGLAAFHVDELGSAMSFDSQCFNREHNHPIGGGTLYADSRRRMVTTLRDSTRKVRPDFAIHHEVLCEIYIDVADAAEVCTTPSNNNIPLYEAVYHDYNLIMGRRIMEWNDRNLFPLGHKDGDAEIDEFVSSFAQTYIWGNQPGWTRSDIVQYAPRVAAVIKRFMQARYRAMKFLNHGDMMRPLILAEPLPIVSRTWRYCDTLDHELPVVYNSVWKAADGTIGIVLANITDQPQTISYQCDLSECGLTSDRFDLTRIDGEAPQSLGTVTGPILSRQDTIPGYNLMIIQVSPTD